MKITLNGEIRDVGDGTTVAGLLKDLGFPTEGVVVEINGTIIDRTQFEYTKFSEGDRVELVRFVGGG